METRLALVLHAHLPFVRHPEHEQFLEESWLYEATLETHLPLLECLDRWQQDRLPVRLTLSISPTLASMWADPLLCRRFERYLDHRIDLAGKEVFRTLWEPGQRIVAELYLRRFLALRERWTALGGDLLGAFRRAQESGLLELATTGATHALLPLLADCPAALRAQVRVACRHHAAWFGRPPTGFWLPECAYAEAVEPVLRAEGLRWFLLESHGIAHASPRPAHGVYASVLTPGGLIAFGRDPVSARQVWSRAGGYPGDPRYRDFYRDLGYDLDFDYVRPYLPSPVARGFTGLKYYRITGPHAEKAVYEPGPAAEAVREHAAHFCAGRREQGAMLAATMGRPPLIVAPYDAELFGHWWYEGIDFLDAVARQACQPGSGLRLVGLSECVAGETVAQCAQPSPSTWGEEGHLRVWLNPRNEWVWREVQPVVQLMARLAREHGGLSPQADRLLGQAARETMLAQASDWPFMLHQGACAPYATHRVKIHLERLALLHDQLCSGVLDEPVLAQIEAQDSLFPHLRWDDWTA
jgi:1,4-alpha-glucan branching enzyme